MTRSQLKSMGFFPQDKRIPKLATSTMISPAIQAVPVSFDATAQSAGEVTFVNSGPQRNEEDCPTDDEMIRDSRRSDVILTPNQLDQYTITLTHQQEESQSLNVRRYPWDVEEPE